MVDTRSQTIRRMSTAVSFGGGRMSLANVEFDQWVVCPKCLTAMVGLIDELCFICQTPMQATPLYPDSAQDMEQEGASDEREYLLAELGVEYTDAEEEVLFELGL